MAEAKGDKQKQQKENTTVSEGALEEYNCTTNQDLSILTKRVQSRQKCRAPIFMDPPKPCTIYKQTSKDPKLRRSTRQMQTPFATPGTSSNSNIIGQQTASQNKIQ
eukprot:1015092-Ditylum_brightwellii.AAC.1